MACLFQTMPGWAMMWSLLGVTAAMAQSANPPEEVGNELEILVEETAAEEEAELEVMDLWEDLLRHPVALNRAGVSDLLQVPGIRPAYAEAIIRYRQKHGAFTSLDELSRVPRLPGPVAERIRPFVTLGSPTDRLADTWANPRYWLAGFRMETVTRMRTTLQTADGFRPDLAGETAYAGSKMDRYQRIHIRSKHISAGMTMRSGAGAPGTWARPNLGSSHLHVAEMQKMETLVIGNFRLRYGMGLAMNTGYAPRKGFVAVNPSLSLRTVAPFSGSSYSGHHRGAAATWGHGAKISVWWSARPYTASRGDADSVRWSAAEPYFRTCTERERRDNLRVRMVGGRLLMPWRTGMVGVAGWHASTDRPLSRGAGLHRQADPAGSRFRMLSMDFRQSVFGSSVSGEFAMDHQGKSAAILALESSFPEGIEHTAIFRRYDPEFQSLFGKAFSAWSGAPSNELGMYSALSFRQGRTAEVLLFVDLYRSIWPRPAGMLPEQGADLGSKVQLRWGGGTLAVWVRKRQNHGWAEMDDLVGRGYLARTEREKFHVRAELTSGASQKWMTKTRAEWTQFSPSNLPTASGTMVFQEVRWKPGQRWGLQARVCLFRTEGYDARLVAHEPDVALVSGSFSMQGEGSRQFVVASFRPWKRVEVQAKWAQTRWHGVTQVGSGNDRIEGDTKTTINVSIRTTL